MRQQQITLTNHSSLNHFRTQFLVLDLIVYLLVDFLHPILLLLDFLLDLACLVDLAYNVLKDNCLVGSILLKTTLNSQTN